MDVRNLEVCTPGSPERPPSSFQELLSRFEDWEEGRISSLQEEGSPGQLQTDWNHQVPRTGDPAPKDWKGPTQGEEREVPQWKDTLSHCATDGQ